jgi:glycosyltransferase involved in cell wall biosynthesis
MNVLNVHKPIIVATVPNAVEYLERFADCKVVYYCVDDFSLWPGVESALVREMETRLIARADLIIAASSALQQRFEEVRKPASLLTHGVDVEMFSVPAGRELESLRDIRCPRVGFYGLVDGRMDWELLVNLARRMPSISFVFAGPLDASVGTPPIVNNIHFIGAIAYEKLPEFILGMSVLILPYKRNELGKVLSPLKIKEYLSTSKPVVCTPIAATVEWEGVVALGSTAVEWERLIRQFLEGGQIARDGLIMDRFIGQSWSDKAQEFLRLCVATSGES